MKHSSVEVKTRLLQGPVLVMDTAGRSCQVGIISKGKRIAGRSPEMTHGQAESLIPLVQEVMTELDLEYNDLKAVVVTAGPGSFTGLRVGLAAAQGFAVVAKCPVIAVSSLAAWAMSSLSECQAECQGRAVRVVLDSRRNDAFVQDFGCDGQVCSDPSVMTLDDAINAGGKMVYVGDLVSSLAAPSLEGIFTAACRDEHQLPPHPIYLRPPDAVPCKGAAGASGEA